MYRTSSFCFARACSAAFSGDVVERVDGAPLLVGEIGQLRAGGAYRLAPGDELFLGGIDPLLGEQVHGRLDVFEGVRELSTLRRGVEDDGLLVFERELELVPRGDRPQVLVGQYGDSGFDRLVTVAEFHHRDELGPLVLYKFLVGFGERHEALQHDFHLAGNGSAGPRPGAGI